MQGLLRVAMAYWNRFVCTEVGGGKMKLCLDSTDSVEMIYYMKCICGCTIVLSRV